VFGGVEEPNASLPAIETYFGNLVRYHTTVMRAMGCLMANTMSELASDDPDVHERTRNHTLRQLSGFERALGRAVELREVRADLDIAAAAEYLVIAVQGLAIYSRINPDPALLSRFVETALSTLH